MKSFNSALFCGICLSTLAAGVSAHAQEDAPRSDAARTDGYYVSHEQAKARGGIGNYVFRYGQARSDSISARNEAQINEAACGSSEAQKQQGYYVAQNEAQARGGVGSYVSRSRYGSAGSTEQLTEANTQNPSCGEKAAVAAPAAPQPNVAAVKTIDDIISKLEGELLFNVDSAELRPEAKQDLIQLSDVLKQNPKQQIRIEGFTDSTGSTDHNLSLSERRADAVRTELAAQGVDASQLQAQGFGESRPVASNATSEGRAQNRRSEIHIVNVA